MNELITPYFVEQTFEAEDGAALASLCDKNGFWVATCFEQDADELLKRINDYEQLQATNRQLSDAVKAFNTWAANNLPDDLYADLEPLIIDGMNAITNAKQREK